MDYSLMVSFSLLLREYKAEAIRLMNTIHWVNSLNFINDLNFLLPLSESGCSVTYGSTLHTSNPITRGICGMDDDYVSALACLRDTIPSFDFNIFTNKDTSPSKAQQTLASALFSEMVKDMEVRFDMTVRQKAVFEC
ncbi:hypothetical protein Tco_1231285 [Tanacetum coccineum]